MGYQSPPQSLSNGTVFTHMQRARQSGLGDQSRKAACFASPVCPLSWRRLPPPPLGSQWGLCRFRNLRTPGVAGLWGQGALLWEQGVWSQRAEVGYQRRAGLSRTLCRQGAEQVVGTGGGVGVAVTSCIWANGPLLGLEIDVILMQEM